VSFARVGWAAAAAVLLAAGGCDYWDNLVDNKTLTRADLELKVVDAWTDEALAGASCRDSLQSVSITTDEKGVFRIVAGATGQYAFTCSHEWYFDSVVNVHLTKEGAHVVAKLARRGLADWYPQAEVFRQVGIPRPDGSVIRFPLDLDWQATPTDTTGRFRYEWTFLHTDRLNHGRWVDHIQLDPESYSPRFRPRASTETGVQAGPDTVILKVYSLMAMSQTGGYLVGTDSMPFEWVRNIKPVIHFKAPFDSNPPTFKVGCGNEAVFARVNIQGSDSDGQCAKIEFWTPNGNAPSVGKIDTILSCEEPSHSIRLRLTRPPGSDGSEEYENTLFAEITDNNGEKGRDSVTFKTYTNSLPRGGGFIVNPRDAYFVGDPITFEVHGKDTDGGIQQLEIQWTNPSPSDDSTISVPWESPNFPFNDSEAHSFTNIFSKPGKYLSVGKAIDNCGDSVAFNGPPFIVLNNTLPSISVANITSTPSPGGDTLYVQFNLTVTDNDKTYGDSLTSVSVNWGVDGTDSVPHPASSYPYAAVPKHVYTGPQINSSLSIQVHAEDAHSGEAKLTVKVP